MMEVNWLAIERRQRVKKACWKPPVNPLNWQAINKRRDAIAARLNRAGIAQDIPPGVRGPFVSDGSDQCVNLTGSYPRGEDAQYGRVSFVVRVSAVGGRNGEAPERARALGIVIATARADLQYLQWLVAAMQAEWCRERKADRKKQRDVELEHEEVVSELRREIRQHKAAEAAEAATRRELEAYKNVVDNLTQGGLDRIRSAQASECS